MNEYDRDATRTEKEERTLFVGNVAYEVTASDLAKGLAQYGVINTVNMITFPSGKPKGCAFVEFETREAADKAARLLETEPIEVYGRQLRASLARPLAQKNVAESRHNSMTTSGDNGYRSQSKHQNQYYPPPPSPSYPPPMYPPHMYTPYQHPQGPAAGHPHMPGMPGTPPLIPGISATPGQQPLIPPNLINVLLSQFSPHPPSTPPPSHLQTQNHPSVSVQPYPPPNPPMHSQSTLPPPPPPLPKDSETDKSESVEDLPKKRKRDDGDDTEIRIGDRVEAVNKQGIVVGTGKTICTIKFDDMADTKRVKKSRCHIVPENGWSFQLTAIGSMAEDELLKYLQEFGEIRDLDVPTDKRTGRAKGYAYVEMASRSSALKAMHGYSETISCGQVIPMGTWAKNEMS